MTDPQPKFVVIFAPNDGQRAVWVHQVLQDAGFASRVAPRSRSPLTVEQDEQPLAIVSKTSETMTPPSNYLALVATGRAVPVTFDKSPMPSAFRAVKTLLEMISVPLGTQEERAAQLLERLKNLPA